jgi:hypothetical protein
MKSKLPTFNQFVNESQSGINENNSKIKSNNIVDKIVKYYNTILHKPNIDNRYKKVTHVVDALQKNSLDEYSIIALRVLFHELDYMGFHEFVNGFMNGELPDGRKSENLYKKAATIINTKSESTKEKKLLKFLDSIFSNTLNRSLLVDINKRFPSLYKQIDKMI